MMGTWRRPSLRGFRVRTAAPRGWIFKRMGFLVVVLLLTGGCRSEFMEKLGWGSWGYNQGYSPDQPIPFDHSLHVGQYGLQCLYCHNQEERSQHANIPALSTCMNCHMSVKTDSPWIQKISEAYNAGRGIEWVKVHMLPDHVHFNHEAHVAKGVNCQTCHGPVETMKKIYQYSNLSMGWCVNCHREDQNKAPLNCSTCHH